MTTPTAPACYRHPDRATYVRCTRCNRYICPECMRDAAVGHQCAECVGEAAKTVRQPQTAFGGQPILARESPTDENRKPGDSQEKQKNVRAQKPGAESRLHSLEVGERH